MLTIAFLAIILICLAVVVIIVVRKFPQLTGLDLGNLAQEQQSQVKKAIISKQIAKHNLVLKATWNKRLQPLVKAWKILQLKFRIYVGKIEHLWHYEQSFLKNKTAGKIDTNENIQKESGLIAEGEQAFANANYNRAEELFIAAIKLNKHSLGAYRGLANTYLVKNSLEEARETYKFLLHLNPNDDEVMAKLSEIAEIKGDLQEAIQYLQQSTVLNDSFAPRFYHLAELLIKLGQPLVAKDSALEAVRLESKNPKYLDLLVETAIICGDRSLAQVYFNELRLVNPENKKLSDLLIRIDRL